MSQFRMVDPFREQQRAAIARDLAAFWGEMGGAHKPEEKFSVVRMINSIAEGNFHEGKSHEANVCQAAALTQGSTFDQQRVVIPWGVFARDLVAATPTAGGNLVGSYASSAVDVLRPYSVVARMGVESDPGLTQNLLVPNVGTAVTGKWLADESDTLNTGDPVIGMTTSTPKTGGALVKASYLFMRQAQQAERFIRRQLLGVVGAMLDQAVLQGTGASGQPTGLSVADGVGAQSGAVTHANMLDILETLGDANANDENIRFLTTPAMRRILQARETVSTSGRMIWEKGQLVDTPASVSTYCPAATIFAGDWSQCRIAMWGAGLQIEVDPYTSFKTGAVHVRVLMHADVNFMKPAAFVRHTSAT